MRGSESKSGGGDRVLESKHVIGLFLLMLVFSGVFFSLGYVMGRSQYETQVRADGDEVIASVKEARRSAAHASSNTSATNTPPMGRHSQSDNAENSPKPAESDWDFYHSHEPAKPEPPVGKMRESSSKSRTPARSDQFQAPLIPGGAIVLQVSASTKQSDALSLAQSLQKKGFPAFVLTPGADRYYRVQVGPYADQGSANIAKKGLENAGFKAIAKR